MDGTLRNHPPLSERLNKAWNNHACWQRDLLAAAAAGALLAGIGWMLGAYATVGWFEQSAKLFVVGSVPTFLGCCVDRMSR